MDMPLVDRRRPRVALIEDDESLALLLSYNLEAAGWSVECMLNGATALDRLIENPPDIIILDWNLPGLAGIEILRHVRRDSRTKTLPVLMLTGKTEVQCRDRAMALGANAFLTKPFVVQDVMSCLHRLLQRAPVAAEPELATTT